MRIRFSVQCGFTAALLLMSFAAAAQTFNVTKASASPTSASPGQTVQLAASVQSSVAVQNVIVDLEVYNTATWGKVAQKYYADQNFQAIQSVPYTVSYTLPAGLAPGRYAFMVGVFTAGWSSDIYWDSSAAYFTVVNSPVAVNGACGSSNDATVMSAPVANLCATGTASAVGGTGPWNWSCTGTNGGTASSCSAAVASTSNVAANCGMQLGGAVIFCDTFDSPSDTGTRSGDLNGNVWGVSRASAVNFGQRQYNLWNATTIQKCDGTTATVTPPDDIIICNGQLREASNDNNTGQFENGDVTSLAMYPKQSFDFAGRTGTVSFDVSNDTAGTHSAWPEFWMSDLPVPDPFTHFSSWLSLPANGFGIRMASESEPGQYGGCPNGNNLTQYRWTVDSVIVSRGYVEEDTAGPYGVSTGVTLTALDCVVMGTGPGSMNHVEIRISQNQIDVYATDAGVAATPATLRHIATVTKANLTLTRGFIWLEDVHYNADKGDPTRPSEREHTFSWDNVAFDGPFTDRDFAYDAPDNTLPGPNGAVNLAQFSAANQTSTWNVPGLPVNPQAAAARVLFNFNGEANPNATVLNVIVNGHAHTVPWPYPDQFTNTWRSYAVTIPLTDLVAGTNVVQLGANTAQVISNVDIVLGDVVGGVPALPGANDKYPVN